MLFVFPGLIYLTTNQKGQSLPGLLETQLGPRLGSTTLNLFFLPNPWVRHCPSVHANCRLWPSLINFLTRVHIPTSGGQKTLGIWLAPGFEPRTSLMKISILLLWAIQTIHFALPDPTHCRIPPSKRKWQSSSRSLCRSTAPRSLGCKGWPSGTEQNWHCWRRHCHPDSTILDCNRLCLIAYFCFHLSMVGPKSSECFKSSHSKHLAPIYLVDKKLGFDPKF